MSRVPSVTTQASSDEMSADALGEETAMTARIEVKDVWAHLPQSVSGPAWRRLIETAIESYYETESPSEDIAERFADDSTPEGYAREAFAQFSELQLWANDEIAGRASEVDAVEFFRTHGFSGLVRLYCWCAHQMVMQAVVAAAESSR